MTGEHIADWAAARSDKWRRQLDGLEAMLGPVDQPLIAALDLTAPLRIADIGCGSGATTREILRRAPAGSVVHGFDLSPALIEIARRRHAGGDDAARFEIADMAQAAPPERPYDRLVSRFGIMFFNDASAAFANLRRWLVPGGRVAFAAWGPVEDNGWMKLTREAVEQVIALPPVDPTAPGPFRYADPAPLLSVLHSAGFTGLRVRDWRESIPLGGRFTADAAAQFALASFSSFAELLADAGGDAMNEARRALASRFAAYAQQGVVMTPARVHIITAVAG
jgi:SAM-dependent methyltransferase